MTTRSLSTSSAVVTRLVNSIPTSSNLAIWSASPDAGHGGSQATRIAAPRLRCSSRRAKVPFRCVRAQFPMAARQLGGWSSAPSCLEAGGAGEGRDAA
jgi:hypothetical protein